MDATTWKTRTLFQKAYARTLDRLNNYINVSLAGFALLIVSLSSIIFLGLISASWMRNQETVLLILAAAAGIILLLNFFYIAFWVQLATTYALISSKKMDTRVVYSTVKPQVKGYIKYTVLSTLFAFFLTPADLLISTVLLVRPFSIIWSYWGTFSIFVYLEKQKKGLDILWTSRAMINQQFWTVGRKLFIGGFAYFLVLLVGIIPVVIIFSSNFDRTTPISSAIIVPVILFIVLIAIISLFMTPFLLSFNYEVYKNLSTPKEIKRPKEWIWIGIAGIVIGITLLFFAPQKINESWQQYIKDSKIQTPR